MLNIGPPEILLVLVIALVVVGPSKLPELARTIGRGLSEFRKVQDEVKDMVKLDLSLDPVTTPEAKVPPRTVHRSPRTSTTDAEPSPAATDPASTGRDAAPTDEPTNEQPDVPSDEPSDVPDPSSLSDPSAPTG